MTDMQRLEKLADPGTTHFKQHVEGITVVRFTLRGHPWQCQYDAENRGLYAFSPTGYNTELDAIEAVVAPREKLQEIADLFTDSFYADAVKELRRMHGLVNRFVCQECGFITNRCACFLCPKCEGRVDAKVVVDNTTKG